jgi:predicted transcriptional regulator
VKCFERDLMLKARYLAGETLSALAREVGLTPQRVFQIIDHQIK